MEILWFKNVGCISAFFDFARNDGLVGDSRRQHLSCGSAFVAVTGGIVKIPYL
jgi:hypothetical protein